MENIPIDVLKHSIREFRKVRCPELSRMTREEIENFIRTYNIPVKEKPVKVKKPRMTKKEKIIEEAIKKAAPKMDVSEQALREFTLPEEKKQPLMLMDNVEELPQEEKTPIIFMPPVDLDKKYEKAPVVNQILGDLKQDVTISEMREWAENKPKEIGKAYTAWKEMFKKFCEPLKFKVRYIYEPNSLYHPFYYGISGKDRKLISVFRSECRDEYYDMLRTRGNEYRMKKFGDNGRPEIVGPIANKLNRGQPLTLEDINRYPTGLLYQFNSLVKVTPGMTNEEIRNYLNNDVLWYGDASILNYLIEEPASAINSDNVFLSILRTLKNTYNQPIVINDYIAKKSKITKIDYKLGEKKPEEKPEVVRKSTKKIKKIELKEENEEKEYKSNITVKKLGTINQYIEKMPTNYEKTNTEDWTKWRKKLKNYCNQIDKLDIKYNPGEDADVKIGNDLSVKRNYALKEELRNECPNEYYAELRRIGNEYRQKYRNVDNLLTKLYGPEDGKKYDGAIITEQKFNQYNDAIYNAIKSLASYLKENKYYNQTKVDSAIREKIELNKSKFIQSLLNFNTVESFYSHVNSMYPTIYKTLKYTFNVPLKFKL